MTNTSKIALVAALAASLASPALAQSYSKGEGTGNVLSFSYDFGGGRSSDPARILPNRQASVRERSHNQVAAAGPRRLYNYAPIGSEPRPNAVGDSSAAAGGGSAGYNAMVQTY